MDEQTHTALIQRALPNTHLIQLEELEQSDTALLQAKANRTLVEYYFTCTPVLPLFILTHYPDVDLITYLDADLFFFANPEPLYAEIAAHSIAISAHRFPPRLLHLEKTGIYNVAWLSFRQDQIALACLRRWREQCLEWCYDRIESGRYADQKYLDDWPTSFANVRVLQHKGANLAPWNLDNYHIRAEGSCVWIDEQPLIFFHYQGLERVTDWWYNSNSAHYGTRLSSLVRRKIYGPYLRALAEATSQSIWVHELRSDLPQTPESTHTLERYLRLFRGLFSHKYIFVVKNQVI